jgi:hypothetical protein
MEIERLSFQVNPPERMEAFIKADAQVWDPWLRAKKGFLRKVYQEYPGGRVDIRIFWTTKKALAEASKDPDIPAIEVRMRSQFLGVYTRLPTL